MQVVSMKVVNSIKPGKLGKVRIIGGKWRGRKLVVPGNVRPTPDRVRETLFNWLTSRIYGAVCLDMFSGSGVLGFEALSRGASYVIMVDELPQVVSCLRQAQSSFTAQDADIYGANVLGDLRWMSKLHDRKFNIVFVDPPYKDNLVYQSFKLLEHQNLLADNSLIYVETNQHIVDLPSSWVQHRYEVAGQVHYHLFIHKPQCGVD